MKHSPPVKHEEPSTSVAKRPIPESCPVPTAESEQAVELVLSTALLVTVETESNETNTVTSTKESSIQRLDASRSLPNKIRMTACEIAHET